MARRVFLLCLIIMCIVCLSFCTSQTESTNESNQDTSFKPYQKITLWESELALSPNDKLLFNDELRKNLVNKDNLSNQRVEQLIENGKFESRHIESGNIAANQKMDWRYIVSADIVVWKSEDYFAVCSMDAAEFTPYLIEQQINMIGSDAWCDAEDGFFKPQNKSERIVVVIGRTGYLKVKERQIDSSKLYLEKVSITY